MLACSWARIPKHSGFILRFSEWHWWSMWFYAHTMCPFIRNPFNGTTSVKKTWCWLEKEEEPWRRTCRSSSPGYPDVWSQWCCNCANLDDVSLCSWEKRETVVQSLVLSWSLDDTLPVSLLRSISWSLFARNQHLFKWQSKDNLAAGLDRMGFAAEKEWRRIWECTDCESGEIQFSLVWSPL